MKGQKEDGCIWVTVKINPVKFASDNWSKMSVILKELEKMVRIIWGIPSPNS